MKKLTACCMDPYVAILSIPYSFIWLYLSLCLDKRGPKDLSEEPHYVGDGHDHNTDYDHEAFLGKEQAETFEQLAPEEAKRRLGYIFACVRGNMGRSGCACVRVCVCVYAHAHRWGVLILPDLFIHSIGGRWS